MCATVLGDTCSTSYVGATSVMLEIVAFSACPPRLSKSETVNTSVPPPREREVRILQPLAFHGFLGSILSALISLLISDQTFCPYTRL